MRARLGRLAQSAAMSRESPRTSSVGGAAPGISFRLRASRPKPRPTSMSRRRVLGNECNRTGSPGPGGTGPDVLPRQTPPSSRPTTTRCWPSGAWRRRSPRPTRCASSVASCTFTSARRRWPSAPSPTLKPEDYVIATYREHAHAYAKGMSARVDHRRAVRQGDRLLEGPGRLDAPVRRRAKNFLGGYGIVGGHIPLAAGTAFASKYRGDGRVTLCFFGDGSVAQGAFHEGVALAALWRLPVVFICENNLYSMGTPLYRSLSVADVSQKALGYGIARDRFDGDDVIRVRDRVAEAVRRARNESMPTLIEISDLPLSRPLDVGRRPLPDEGRGRGVEEARPDHLRPRPARAREDRREGDRRHRGEGHGRDRRRREVRRREPRAGLRAPAPSSRTRSNGETCGPLLFAKRSTRPWPKRWRRTTASSSWAKRSVTTTAPTRCRRACSSKFGEKRVIDTPIAEGGFVGVGIGAAMVGLRPDHRAHDLELLARRGRPADQQRRQDPPDVGRAVHAAGRLPRPGRLGAHAGRAAQPVDRGALGAHPGAQGRHAGEPEGRQGPAQERHPRRQPDRLHRGRGALRRPGRDPRRRVHHPARRRRGEAPGQGHHHHRLVEDGEDRARRRPTRSPAEGIEVEVVDPRTIRPLDEELLVESVKKTGRCLIIEEGWPFNGVGAEIAYRVGRRCFDDLDAPVERLTGADMPMPYNHHLEQQCIPDVPRAVAAVKKLLYLE